MRFPFLLGGAVALLLAGCQSPTAGSSGPAPGTDRVIKLHDVGVPAQVLKSPPPDTQTQAPDDGTNGTASGSQTDTERHTGVTVLAGSGDAGEADGLGAAASFQRLAAMVVTPAGDLYVLDAGKEGSGTVRRVSAAGQVETIAGNHDSHAGADGVGAAASFHDPGGLALDDDGHLWVTQFQDAQLRQVDPATKKVITVGAFDESNRPVYLGTDLIAAGPSELYSLTSDQALNVESGGYTVRHIAIKGAIGTTTIVAGTEKTLGTSGDAIDGTIDKALFYRPDALAKGKDGRLFVADGITIRAVTLGDKVTTLAGSLFGRQDGQGAAARLGWILDLAVDEAGDIYFLDNQSQEKRTYLRKVTPDGQVTTPTINSDPRLKNAIRIAAGKKGELYVFSDGKLLKVVL